MSLIELVHVSRLWSTVIIFVDLFRYLPALQALRNKPDQRHVPDLVLHQEMLGSAPSTGHAYYQVEST